MTRDSQCGQPGLAGLWMWGKLVPQASVLITTDPGEPSGDQT